MNTLMTPGYPDFFADVPTISLHDPLAEFLGATRDGVLQYGYLDALRLAGHSCPTVASAYCATVGAWRRSGCVYFTACLSNV